MFGGEYPGENYPAEGFGNLAMSGTTICTTVNAPERGILGMIFTIRTVTGFGQLAFEAYTSCDSSGAPVGSPDLQMFIGGVPANHTLIVDCAKHTIILYAPDGSATDGTPLLLLGSQGLQWIEIVDCDDLGFHFREESELTCVCVRASSPIGGSTATVIIDSQIREG